MKRSVFFYSLNICKKLCPLLLLKVIHNLVNINDNIINKYIAYEAIFFVNMKW